MDTKLMLQMRKSDSEDVGLGEDYEGTAEYILLYIYRTASSTNSNLAT